MIFFKSSYFRNYIYMILNKHEGDSISLGDLDKIDSLTLNCKTLRGTPNDVAIEDLLYFTNLKNCTLVNFEITDKEIFVLNNCTNLSNLQFFKCSFSKPNEKLNVNINMLSVISCSKFSIKYILGLENLTILNISDMEKVKLNGIENLHNLEKLYLQNIKNLNIAPIKFIPGLLYLNLDGSNVKNTKLLEEFRLYIRADVNDTRFISDPYMKQIFKIAN